MIRKMIMVACASLFTTLGRKIQAMLIFIFLLFVIMLQNYKKPFMSRNLNNLESLSILALLFSIYAGIFFVTDKANNTTAKASRNEFTLQDYEKLILYLLFILSNLVFFAYWGFLFLVELRRFMRVKFQKFFHYLCLFNNKNAVNREVEGRIRFLRNEELMDYNLGLKYKFIQVKDSLKKNYELLQEDALIKFIFKCYRESSKLKRDEILSSNIDPNNSSIPKRKIENRANYIIQNDLSIEIDFSKELDKRENQTIMIKSQMNFNEESEL